MKNTFLGALAKDGAINEPAISFENIGQAYGPLQKQAAESVEKQGPLIEKIKVTLFIECFFKFIMNVIYLQAAHAQFVSERGSTASGRESMMCSLASAHDVFRDLQNNLKEGTKFYNDLTEVKTLLSMNLNVLFLMLFRILDVG